MKLFLCLLISLLSHAAHSQGEGAWRSNYKGVPSFRLSDDLAFREQKQSVETAEAQLQVVIDKLVKQDNQKIRLAGELKSSKNKILKKNEKIEKNKLDLKKIDSKISELETSLLEFQNKISKKIETISSKKEQVALLDLKFKKIDKKYKDLKLECDRNSTKSCIVQLASLKTKWDNAKSLLSVSKEELGNLKKNLVSLKNKLKEQSLKVDELKKKISEIKLQNEVLKKEIISLKTSEGVNEKKLAETITRINNLEKIKIKKESILVNEKRATALMRRNLIEIILRANKEGVSDASYDGNLDGTDLARTRGKKFGIKDGRADGLFQGANIGKEREYLQGSLDGELKGAKEGESEGTQKGIVEGTNKGNEDAALAQSKIAAKDSSERSDAIEVGELEGIQSGLTRAKQVGEKEGKAQGINEVIKQREAQNLKSINQKGPYAGAFNSGYPGFIKGYEGRSFNPSEYRSHRLARLAYQDGYKYEYFAAAEDAYFRLIETVYNNHYNKHFDRSKNEALNQYYKESYDSGYSEKYNKFYSLNYDVFYAANYKAKKDQFLNAPDRSSLVFKSVFNSNYNKNYEYFYNKLKSSAFTKAELNTFNENVQEQREIFRLKFTEITKKEYSESAVLEFSSVELKDKGVEGVAANDQIFQPSESVMINLLIKNYGDKASNNLKFKVPGQKEINLKIPALSSVFIEGAGGFKIDSLEQPNRNFLISSSLEVLGAEGISSKNFERKNILKEINSEINVKYPFELKNLKLTSNLKVEQDVGIEFDLIALSKKPYAGEFEINTEIIGGNVAFKDFNKLKEVIGDQKIKGASVKVSEDDALKTLDFKIKVYKKGVLLGKMERPLSVIAHLAYSQTSSKPVLLLESSKDSSKALDILSELGGVSSVNVLDLDLSENSNFLNKEIKDKVIIVLGDSIGIKRIIDNSKKASLVHINDFSSFKSFSIEKEVFYSYNLNDYSLSFSTLPMLSSNLTNLSEALAFAEVLKMDEEEAISQLNSLPEASLESFELELEALSLLALYEIKKINSKYISFNSKRKKRRFLKKKITKEPFFLFKLGSSTNNSIGELAFSYGVFKFLDDVLSEEKFGAVLDKSLVNAFLGKGLAKGKLIGLKKKGKELKKVNASLYEEINKGNEFFRSALSF